MHSQWEGNKMRTDPPRERLNCTGRPYEGKTNHIKPMLLVDLREDHLLEQDLVNVTMANI